MFVPRLMYNTPFFYSSPLRVQGLLYLQLRDTLRLEVGDPHKVRERGGFLGSGVPRGTVK